MVRIFRTRMIKEKTKRKLPILQSLSLAMSVASKVIEEGIEFARSLTLSSSIKSAKETSHLQKRIRNDRRLTSFYLPWTRQLLKIGWTLLIMAIQ
jgi:hypothetical protein